MTPDLDLTTLLALGGAVVGVVAWLIRQDRRIEDQRQTLASLQTREQCGACRREVDARLAAADKESALVVQRLDALTATLAELRQMLAQLQSDVSAIAVQQRQPIRRTRTGEIPE